MLMYVICQLILQRMQYESLQGRITGDFIRCEMKLSSAKEYVIPRVFEMMNVVVVFAYK